MEALKKLRKEQKVNQETLAELLNVTTQAYSRYERGERELGYDSLIKLADYFNVSVDYLIEHKSPLSEWTAEEKALGVGDHPTHLSAKEWNWLELRSEVIGKYGEAYLDTVEKMLRTLVENNPKK